MTLGPDKLTFHLIIPSLYPFFHKIRLPEACSTMLRSEKWVRGMCLLPLVHFVWDSPLSPFSWEIPLSPLTSRSPLPSLTLRVPLPVYTVPLELFKTNCLAFGTYDTRFSSESSKSDQREFSYNVHYYYIKLSLMGKLKGGFAITALTLSELI